MTAKIDGTLGITFPDNTIRGSGGIVAGAFKKLAVTTTGLSALVTITADAVALENLSTFSPVIARSVNLSIDTSTTGLNGMDTGSVAANTWYYGWIISDGTNVRAVASLSATSFNNSAFPTYVYGAVVTAFRTDSTGNKYPLNFVQYGRHAQTKIQATTNVPSQFPTIVSGATSGTQSLANYVPPIASEVDLYVVQGTNNTTVGPNNLAALDFINLASGSANVKVNVVLEAQSVYYNSTNSGSALQCVGWTLNL